MHSLRMFWIEEANNQKTIYKQWLVPLYLQKIKDHLQEYRVNITALKKKKKRKPFGTDLCKGNIMVGGDKGERGKMDNSSWVDIKISSHFNSKLGFLQ